MVWWNEYTFKVPLLLASFSYFPYVLKVFYKLSEKSNVIPNLHFRLSASRTQKEMLGIILFLIFPYNENTVGRTLPKDKK